MSPIDATAVLTTLWKNYLPKALVVAKSQWKGAVVIAAILISYWFFCIRPVVDKYYEVGAFMGECTVSKGERKTVSLPDLVLEFDDDMYRLIEGSEAEIPDTVYYYPHINVSYDGKGDKRQSRFKVGQRLAINAANYSYTIELCRLDEVGADTVAHLKVYRCEHPETRRDDK